MLRTLEVVSFCNFGLLFWSFVSSALSLSLSRVCSLRVHISLSCLWQHSRSNSLSLSLACSLAHTHKIDRQREPKTHNRQDKRSSGEAEVEDFFITNVRCAAELLLSSGKRSKRRSKGGGGGGGGVLVGRSVGLMFSWCRGTYELRTLMPLSFHLFFVAILFCFLCSWAVLVLILILSFVWTREMRRLCCCCCGFCVRACFFFSYWMCVIVVCFFSSRFAIPNFSPQKKRTCRAEGLFGFGFFSLWSDVLLLVRNAVLSLSLSLSLSRGLFSFLLCIYRGSDNCCCCFFASLG